MSNTVENFGYEYKHIMKTAAEKKDKAYNFCEGYKNFITQNKTERECVKSIIEIAKKNGYREFENKIEPSGKYFINNRDKAVVLVTMGKKMFDNGINFVVSHIDSPRLDLKANPIFETDDIAYFKTHYYGMEELKNISGLQFHFQCMEKYFWKMEKVLI